MRNCSCMLHHFFSYLTFKLEGHSVERIHLRQRSSDGSVNKTILKPRLALAARRQWDFPDVKFRNSA